MKEFESLNLAQLNKNTLCSPKTHITLFLSLFVILGVFWCLKLTGITLAGDAFCGMEEHCHGEECVTRKLICEKEETSGHVHDDSCILNRLICELDESAAHVHSEECMNWKLVCTETEQEGHTHDKESCYVLDEEEFICGMEESEGHTHGEECYVKGIGFGCTSLPGEEHIHTEECVTEFTELACGEEYMLPHSHDESCYEVMDVCPLEEHIHVESCYSDVTADLETEDDWENSLSNVSEQSTTAETLVMVARSQIGYTESSVNFEVDMQGERRGITRYGQWYGNPYGDWSSMFVAFCMNYAGVGDLPTNVGPESMRLKWEEAGLYEPTGIYEPCPGNLIFFSDRDIALSVGIVTEVKENYITIVQGDYENSVAERTITLDDLTILGYGLLPESSPFALRAAPGGDLVYVARTIGYDDSMFTNGRNFLLYTERDGLKYAIDGNGNAVPVEVRDDGSIYCEKMNTDTLLWTFTWSNYRYVIKNVANGLYLHPYYNGEYNKGVISTNGWATPLTQSGSGVKLINSGSVRLSDDAYSFVITTNQNEAAQFNFGVVEYCTICLDGSNGNLMSLGGTDVENRQVAAGSTITLPSEWKSPEKYRYVLKGWYDIGNRKYYGAGEEVTVTENMLFYADWIAASYDIGRMNSDVVETVSTSEFLTARVFDYNSLFNVLSLNNNYTNGNSTSWTMVENGTVQATGDETLNFIFVDYDNVNNPGAISYPIGRNQANGIDYSQVTFGLYHSELVRLLYDTSVELPGKHYIGLGDHLFQYGDDPNDQDHYGYYYYDSMLNAASYNQSNGRFYVYDYLERTVDSASNSYYSDFLPLNSPYANTNGKNTGVYYYNGVNNEYAGTPHLSYDSKYSDNDNSTDRIGTNYWFGMSMDMEFYLPAVPGTVDSNGVYANQSIVGEDMVFEFAGDDDVWVLIDGELVLDVGGIHGVETGSIDFSTGDVVVDGIKTGTVTNLSSGSHTLTMYYLERGASMSNFKLRFNLSTRYSMLLRKEDTLTAHMLNNAQFAVYTDESCTQAAELWRSKISYENGDSPTNIFTVENGAAQMWGFAAGNVYYLVEVRGPDSQNGAVSKGIIRMRLNNHGLPDYEILPDKDGNLSVGYTVHGYKVDEDKQEAYIVITNTDAKDSIPTEVYVEKVWSDGKNHSSDTITAYLLANGVRIQSVVLSDANKWKHTWKNLPKTDADGNEVVYTVREATIPGYVGKVEEIAAPSGGGNVSGGVTSVNGFTNGQEYLLYTKYGYLGASGNRIQLETDLAAAQNSNHTLWAANVQSDGTVVLTNKNGQTLYYDNYTFKASSYPGTYKNLSFSNGKLYCYINHGSWSETLYPIDNDSVANNVLYNGVLYTTNTEGQALSVTPQSIVSEEPELPSGDGKFYRITNTPAEEAVVSLKVKKEWDLGTLGDVSEYEALTVQMKLLSNGEDAGLVGTFNLRNGWTYTFESLPKYDSGGNEIVYSVEEINLPDGWSVTYGTVNSVNGSEASYEMTVTNKNVTIVELPSTGGIGPYGHLYAGMLIMSSALVWYCGQRRKFERGDC